MKNLSTVCSGYILQHVSFHSLSKFFWLKKEKGLPLLSVGVQAENLKSDHTWLPEKFSNLWLLLSHYQNGHDSLFAKNEKGKVLSLWGKNHKASS